MRARRLGFDSARKPWRNNAIEAGPREASAVTNITALPAFATVVSPACGDDPHNAAPALGLTIDILVPALT